jgi:IS1 family transposase
MLDMLDRSSMLGYVPNMNQLTLDRRCLIARCLLEGNSLRATQRITGHDVNTVTSLLVDLGQAAAEYQGRTLVNLLCTRIEADEIWAFVNAKQAHVPAEKRGDPDWGDCYTFIAIDPVSKIVPCWKVGDRDGVTTTAFIDDLAARMGRRIQFTTDGMHLYIEPTLNAFNWRVDMAQIIKTYAVPQEAEGEHRYSPPRCVGTQKSMVYGHPDPDLVSTSIAERQNLTVRMSIKRFARLTNGFSRKREHLEHAVALHFMHYNFARIHKSIRTTPAMAVGVDDRLWEVEDIVRLLD